jgi:hypothetical protein
MPVHRNAAVSHGNDWLQTLKGPIPWIWDGLVADDAIRPAGVLLLHQVCAARSQSRARGPLAAFADILIECRSRAATASPGAGTSTASAATPARSSTSPPS